MTTDRSPNGGWHPLDPGPRATFDVVRDVDVPMRDGTLLAADLYMPSVDRPVAAVVDRTGYGKAVSPAHWTRSAEYFAAHGLAVVIQDVRGIHGSQGRYYPWKDDGWGELQDGYDTVEWVAQQPWCDGNVGMFGGSYSGATQLRAAVARPPHLKALVSRQAPVSPLASVRPDGVSMLTEGGRWIVEQSRQALLAQTRELEAALGGDTEDFHRGFGDRTFPDQLAWVRDFMDHDHDDPFWDEFDLVAAADRIEVPVLHLGSWYDLHRRSTVAMHDACRQRSPAGGSHRLLMGPWLHGTRWHSDDHGRYVGEVDMGSRAKLDLNALSLGWFEHWLTDRPAPVFVPVEPAQADHEDEVAPRVAGMAPVTYFLMGACEWREATSWPPPGTSEHRWFADGEELATEPSLEVRGRSFTDRYDDPARTIGGDAVLSESRGLVGARSDPGGEQSDLRTRQRGPRDQRSQEGKGVAFTTPTLTAPLTITGRVRATIAATVMSSTGSIGSDAFLVARLSEVVADGRSLDLVDGANRLEVDAQGGVVVVTVDLGDTAVEVPAGHQLRLTILASNFPRAQRRRDRSDLTVTVLCGGRTASALICEASRAATSGGRS